MNADRDVTRIVRSWLKEDAHEDASRVLDEVLFEVDTTPQRRSSWMARRFPVMNNVARIALAVAAVAVAIVIGYQFLGAPNVGGPGPLPTPSPTPSPTAHPTPTPRAIPPAGALGVGRHDFILAGVPLSIDIPSTGWTTNGEFGMEKGGLTSPESAAFILWPDSAADNVFSDPCNQTQLSPPTGPSTAELAAAVATVPGIELVSGPTAVTVGGYPAQHVVIRVPDTIGCAPTDFYLWYDNTNDENARYATQIGTVIYTWIIDVNGTIVWIDGETQPSSSAAAEQEVRQIVDSIRFE